MAIWIVHKVNFVWFQFFTNLDGLRTQAIQTIIRLPMSIIMMHHDCWEVRCSYIII